MLAGGTGSFGYEPRVDYFFGLPRAVTQGGVFLNKPIINVITADNKDVEKRKNFSLQIGFFSSMLEHITPELMFTDANSPGEAVSAVRAIQKAAHQGQRIYQINSQNAASTLPSIHHDPATMSEIMNAVNAGKEVITHTDAISVPGWSGAGYIILDPETGVGAYKISGGANGGGLFGAFGYMLNTLDYFYGALNAIAGTLGKAIPILNKITQFIGIAKFVYGLLDKGMTCSDFSALAWFLTIAAIFSLLVIELTLMIANPIAAYGIGVGLDFAIDWLVDQSPDCH
jgi:hypothetical protein